MSPQPKGFFKMLPTQIILLGYKQVE